MNDFHKKYLHILLRQVDEEISFLNQHGHTNNQPEIPCMFCAPLPSLNKDSPQYRCNRLKTLREFQSQIVHEVHKVNGQPVLPKSVAVIDSLPPPFQF